MNSIDALLKSLRSVDSGERDRAAVALMDMGDARAVPELLRAIARPENVNRRGTLVYALSAFDPHPHLEVLATLVLEGNCEVSTGAFCILEDAVHTTESIARMRGVLDSHSLAEAPEEHHLAAREHLLHLLDAARTSSLVRTAPSLES